MVEVEKLPVDTKSTEEKNERCPRRRRRTKGAKAEFALTGGGLKKLDPQGPALELLLRGGNTGVHSVDPKLKREGIGGRIGGEERREEEVDC